MRLVLRMLGVGFVVSAIAVACGSSDFSSENAPKGQGGAAGSATQGGTGGSSGGTDSGAAGDLSLAGTLGAAGTDPGTGGTGAMGGTAGGGTTLCTDTKDCDDKNPCTLDICPASGVCDYAPKCGGDTPACCNGVCSQCCGMGDCDDGLDCTDNSCFAGVCNYQPSERCDDGFYCSTDPANAPTGCLPIAACDTADDCVDADPCSVGSCVDHKCKFDICPGGGNCCQGVGCGSCCGDSQCPQDACNPSTCTAELKCEKRELCGGDRCCPSPDGKSAQCGTCCEGGDCADDGVECTDETCKAVDGTFLTCLHEPNANHCPMGQTCDVESGCNAAQCTKPEDCDNTTPCKKASCDAGTCKLNNVDCSHSQECCSVTNKCQDCCDNRDCKDAGLNRCCPTTGTCAQCCDNSDCQLAMPTGGSFPQAITGGVGGGTMPCPRPPLCKVGQCVDNSQLCTAEQKCCPGIGCVPTTQLTCGIQTQ